MKAKMIVQSLGVVAAMTFSAGAFAHGNADLRTWPNGSAFNQHPVIQESLRLQNEINDRQDRQMDRILGGMYSKHISPAEFRRLMDEQQDIRRMERASMQDGILTRFEFQKLNDALDAASRRIFHESHDAQGRPGEGGWQSSHASGSWNR